MLIADDEPHIRTLLQQTVEVLEDDGVELLVEPDGAAVVTLQEHGTSFGPDDAPPPDLDSDWDQRRVGGLGWHLIRELTDAVTSPRLDEALQAAVADGGHLAGLTTSVAFDDEVAAAAGLG